jgi:hypothetical protein
LAVLALACYVSSACQSPKTYGLSVNAPDKRSGVTKSKIYGLLRTQILVSIAICEVKYYHPLPDYKAAEVCIARIPVNRHCLFHLPYLSHGHLYIRFFQVEILFFLASTVNASFTSSLLFRRRFSTTFLKRGGRAVPGGCRGYFFLGRR